MMRPTIDSIIEEVLNTTDLVESGEIADEVIRKIKVTDYKVYLKQLIVHRVSSVAGRSRAKVDPARPGLSTKQRLIREQYWPQFLATKVATPSGYKRMGELTAGELLQLSELRYAQGDALYSEGARFKRLHEAVVAAGVSRLEQLSEDRGRKALDQ